MSWEIGFPGLLQWMLQLVAMRNVLTTRIPGFLGADSLSNPMEDGSSLGHEERITDPARQRVRGTLAFNLEMFGTNQTSVVFQTFVL